MITPKVAIIGMPNVGKSSLFNRLLNNIKHSVVSEISNTTIDRIYQKCNWHNYNFMLIDTGGIIFNPNDDILEQVQFQINYAIQEANLLCWVVDNQEELTSDEWKIAKKLLKTKKEIILIVNKTDSFENQNTFYQSFIIKNCIYISCAHGKNIGKLLDLIVNKLIKLFPNLKQNAALTDNNEIKFAFVGETNVGKSTISKKITNKYNYFIASEKENTTRDLLFIPLNYYNQLFYLVDTPGFRMKPNKMKLPKLLYYSYLRTLNSISLCNWIIVVLDATKKITRNMFRLLDYLIINNVNFFIIVNKIDLIDNFDIESYKKTIISKLYFVKFCYFLFTSALYNKNIHKILDVLHDLIKKTQQVVPINLLNNFTFHLNFFNNRPSKGKRKLKVYYVAQKKQQTILTFIIFVNYISLINDNFKRFVVNKFYLAFPNFKGLQIKILYHSKK